MANLIRDKPFETTEAVITIDTRPQPGRYHIQLVVENQRGERSRPVRHILTVLNRIADVEPVPSEEQAEDNHEH